MITLQQVLIIYLLFQEHSHCKLNFNSVLFAFE